MSHKLFAQSNRDSGSINLFKFYNIFHTSANSLSICHTHTLSHSHSLTYSLSLSCTCLRTNVRKFIFTHSLAHSRTSRHSLSHLISPLPPRPYFLSTPHSPLSVCLTLFLLHTHSLSHTHAHTHTHSISQLPPRFPFPLFPSLYRFHSHSPTNSLFVSFLYIHTLSSKGQLQLSGKVERRLEESNGVIP